PGIGAIHMTRTQHGACLDIAKAQPGRPPAQDQRLECRIKQGSQGNAGPGHEHRKNNGSAKARVASFNLAHDLVATLGNRVDESFPVQPDEAAKSEKKRSGQQGPHWQAAKKQCEPGRLKASTKIAIEGIAHLIAFEACKLEWIGKTQA